MDEQAKKTLQEYLHRVSSKILHEQAKDGFESRSRSLKEEIDSKAAEFLGSLENSQAVVVSKLRDIFYKG